MKKMLGEFITNLHKDKISLIEFENKYVIGPAVTDISHPVIDNYVGVYFKSDLDDLADLVQSVSQ